MVSFPVIMFSELRNRFSQGRFPKQDHVVQTRLPDRAESRRDSTPLLLRVSLTMPLRSSREPYRTGVEAFFENLLPDSRQIRERIQRRYRTRTTEAFDLLAEVGRDCVGALQLLPEEAAPANIRSIKAERLSPRAVGVLLDQTLGRTELIAEEAPEFRISLAGAQEKTALLWHDGAWHRPLEATPTTHIIKLPIGPAAHGIDLSALVENEWLCSQILRGYGVPVAENRIARFGEHRVLVVERFDRGSHARRSYSGRGCNAGGLSGRARRRGVPRCEDGRRAAYHGGTQAPMTGSPDLPAIPFPAKRYRLSTAGTFDATRAQGRWL